MSDQRWTPAHLTSPPTVYRVPREIDPESPEPIRLRLQGVDGREFVMPPGTRLYRVGQTQEGILVEYQNAEGAWQTAEGGR